LSEKRLCTLPSDEKFTMLILKNPINHPGSKLIIHDLMPMPKKPILLDTGINSKEGHYLGIPHL
jgi:hypothetical protein